MGITMKRVGRNIVPLILCDEGEYQISDEPGLAVFIVEKRHDFPDFGCVHEDCIDQYRGHYGNIGKYETVSLRRFLLGLTNKIKD